MIGLWLCREAAALAVLVALGGLVTVTLTRCSAPDAAPVVQTAMTGGAS